MESQVKDPAHEINLLQRCVNDLVSLLALPAVWTGREPLQIAQILIDALLRMLSPDFIYVRLNDTFPEFPMDFLQFADSNRLSVPREEIRRIVAECFGDESQQSHPALRTLLGNKEVSLFPVPLGLQGEFGMIVIASDRPDFPGQTESLILSVAANQAFIGLREAKLLGEQRRIANELEQRVADRTAGLAEANEELKKEIVTRKKVEERLRQSEVALQNAFDGIKKSEAKLRRVIDTIPTLAWCNLPDGPNEFLSKRWHEYTGLSPEESHGWGWQVAFHPEDLPALMKTWQELLVSGEPGEIEARLRRHDGIYRWFLIRVEPFRDDTGKIDRWYGTSTDIEELKCAEEKLRRSEDFLAEGQRLTLTGSYSWKMSTNEITWSDQLYRIYDFDVGTAVTLDLIRTRLHPEDVGLIEKMKMVAEAGGATDFEWHWRLKMPDQSIKYLHAVAHATLDRHDQLEYTAAVQDVTARYLSEKALARTRSELAKVARITSLGVLTASIAHEVNQPLSGIITNASTCLRMLSAEPPNVEGARETARRTIRDGNRASDVITRLRTLYSKKEPQLELLDLNETAREVTALSFGELQQNRVSLRQEFAEDLRPVVGDRIQLQQVIMNLLRNASEAMNTVDDRPRELLIRTELEEGEQVRLSVTDVGVGFAPQLLDRLFDAFFTTKTDGMGIGLSISRSIIDVHQGRLWATANRGPGATFSFSIPCAPKASRGAEAIGGRNHPASDAA